LACGGRARGRRLVIRRFRAVWRLLLAHVRMRSAVGAEMCEGGGLTGSQD
jgi:hypothetical protein